MTTIHTIPFYFTPSTLSTFNDIQKGFFEADKIAVTGLLLIFFVNRISDDEILQLDLRIRGMSRVPKWTWQKVDLNWFLYQSHKQQKLFIN